MPALTNRGLDVAIGGIVALFLCGVLAPAATLIVNAHGDALAVAGERAVRAAGGAEAALGGVLASLDAMLGESPALVGGATGADGSLDLLQAERLLAVAASQRAFVSRLALADTDGVVLAASDPSLTRLSLRLPPGFIDQILRHPAPALAISSPQPQAAGPVLYVGRRVALGGREVLALAEVRAGDLGTVMAQGWQSTGLEMSLERPDGELLASVPAADDSAARRLPPLPSATGAGDPARLMPGRLSGAPALLASRPVAGRDLVVVAGVPRSVAMAGWYPKRDKVVVVASLFIVLIIGTGLVTRAYLHRLRAARRETVRARITLNQALGAMTTGFLLIGGDGTVVTWNRRLFALYPWLRPVLATGLPFRRVLETIVAHVLPDAGEEAHKAWVERVLAERGPSESEAEQALVDGRTLRVSRRATRGGGTIFTVRDASAEKQLEVELRIAATAFESHESILITDAAGAILRVNQAFAEATGYRPEEVVGQTPRILKSGRHDAAFYDAMWDELSRNGVWQGEVWNRRKDGEVFPEWVTITAVKGEAGAVSHYVATMTDLSARKAAEEEIQMLAYYDSLTRLPNRRLLIDRLQRTLATSARNGQNGALLLIDLDHFKTLNETLGYEAGDKLLYQVAQRLASCVREGDTVARLGGDEFVVVLHELGSDPRDAAFQTEGFVTRILGSLNHPFLLGPQEYRATPSIGVALFTDHRISPEGLMKRADMAMYQAKKAGRNTFRFFDPEMQAAVEARAELERGLAQALARREFVLYYQPQVDGGGLLHGAEALVRWRHPVRGMVPPNDFIPLAEESGLVVGIGAWVLETACESLKRWESDPRKRHLDLAVNVSARQFRHPGFVEQVIGTVCASGIDPQRLKLELTETLVHEDIGETIARMNALRAFGVRFAMDDFGIGYSSLSNLKKLPLDQLKIDKSFIADIASDPDDLVIVQTIIAMAYNLGMQVIAEGVETEEQRDLLLRRGCSDFQGYLFGKPMPLEEFEDLPELRPLKLLAQKARGKTSAA